MHSAFFKSPLLLLLPIHLVWIGSKLPKRHINKLIGWKKLNLRRLVIVWVETEFMSTIAKQLKGKNIQICDVSELKIPASVRKTIQKFTAQRKDKLPPNAAVASDYYRYYGLNTFGGAYSDFDKIPFTISDAKVSPIFNFKSRQKKEESCTFPPDLILSTSGNFLIQNAITYLERIAPLLDEEESIKLIRSTKSAVRKSATINTTGDVLEGALSTILVDGSRLINPEHSLLKEPRPVLLPQILSMLLTPLGGENCENSWINLPNVNYSQTVTHEEYNVLYLLAEKSFHIFKTIVENHSDSIRPPKWLSLFRDFMKTTSPLKEDKVLDCIEGYMWKTKPSFS